MKNPLRPLPFAATLLGATLLGGCVDLLDLDRPGTVNVVVVDGILNDLPRQQIIRMNRSKADEFTGRFGTLPIKGATVEVLDNDVSVRFYEGEPGAYFSPSDFRARPGHRYQLKLTLAEGQRYVSTVEEMTQPVPMQNLRAQFNATSLPPLRFDGTANLTPSSHDVYVDVQDPPGERNYYRWDWTLWERQDWCKTCSMAWYMIWNRDDTKLLEDCLEPQLGVDAPSQYPYFVNDYECRGRCWEILYKNDIDVFSDALSNGGLLQDRRIGQIPYYQSNGALVEIRQVSLNIEAYQFFDRLRQQTQNVGGVADTPPTVAVGNVRNIANPDEYVVGYFTAAGTTAQRIWLDRKDATTHPPGLFPALNGGLQPSPEGYDKDPNTDKGKPRFPFPKSKYYERVPRAPCIFSNSRTPLMPEGWRDN